MKEKTEITGYLANEHLVDPKYQNPYLLYKWWFSKTDGFKKWSFEKLKSSKLRSAKIEVFEQAKAELTQCSPARVRHFAYLIQLTEVRIKVWKIVFWSTHVDYKLEVEVKTWSLKFEV